MVAKSVLLPYMLFVAFVWRKFEPTIVYVEEKGQISGMQLDGGSDLLANIGNEIGGLPPCCFLMSWFDRLKVVLR